MPRSNGRPKNRQAKKPKLTVPATCKCSGKATKYGLCIRCLDDPFNQAILQAHGIYLPSRMERRTY